MDKGGAIYTLYTDHVLSKSCGYKCSTSDQITSSSYDGYTGQFALLPSYRSNAQNRVSLSTAAHCGRSLSKCDTGAIHIGRGDTTITNLNSSHNTCTSYSGFMVALDYSKNKMNIKYCSICNNQATKGCLNFGSGSTFTNFQINMYYSNIINNRQSSTNSGLLFSSATVYLTGCVFLLNTYGLNLFQCESSTYSFTIVECVIDPNELRKTSNGKYYTDNWAPKSTYIHSIDCLNMDKFCVAQYDITPTIPIPERTPLESACRTPSITKEYKEQTCKKPNPPMKFSFLL